MKRTPMRRGPKPIEVTKIAGVIWPDGHIKDSEFQNDVEKIAAQFGWMTSHSNLPFFDTAGWPDLAMVHPVKARFMVRELKVTTRAGKVPSPSPLQWRWLSALVGAGVDAAVWTYPQDLDRLIAELSA